MRRAMLVPALCLGLLLAAAPARATDLRLGADMAWVRDSSFDTFWTNDLFSRLDICLAYTTFDTVGFRLDAELGYGYAGYLEATAPFAATKSTMAVHDVYAGLRASFDPPGVDWLRPYVRVQGGFTVGLASFTDVGATAAASFDDWDVGGLVYGGGGLEIVLPMRVFMDDPPTVLSEPLAFGVFLEGGYFYRTALAFSPSGAGGDDTIPVEGFSAGDVDLSGGELRTGFLVRM